VFETCVWIGRFIQAWGRGEFVYRKEACVELCGSAKAKDPNIRQALIDRWKPTGGGKTPQVGTQSKPGPLRGISGDQWSALAIAVTYYETRCTGRTTLEELPKRERKTNQSIQSLDDLPF